MWKDGRIIDCALCCFWSHDAYLCLDKIRLRRWCVDAIADNHPAWRSACHNLRHPCRQISNVSDLLCSSLALKSPRYQRPQVWYPYIFYNVGYNARHPHGWARCQEAELPCSTYDPCGYPQPHRCWYHVNLLARHFRGQMDRILNYLWFWDRRWLVTNRSRYPGGVGSERRPNRWTFRFLRHRSWRRYIRITKNVFINKFAANLIEIPKLPPSFALNVNDSAKHSVPRRTKYYLNYL